MALNAENSSRGSRAFKYGANVLIGTVLFLAILGAINFMASIAQPADGISRGVGQPH
jgi:hypothetical protein